MAEAEIPIVSKLILDRDAFLANLRALTAEMDNWKSQLQGNPVVIPVTFNSFDSLAALQAQIDRIQAEGLTIPVNFDGGGGGGGGTTINNVINNMGGNAPASRGGKSGGMGGLGFFRALMVARLGMKAIEAYRTKEEFEEIQGGNPDALADDTGKTEYSASATLKKQLESLKKERETFMGGMANLGSKTSEQFQEQWAKDHPGAGFFEMSGGAAENAIRGGIHNTYGKIEPLANIDAAIAEKKKQISDAEAQEKDIKDTNKFVSAGKKLQKKFDEEDQDAGADKFTRARNELTRKYIEATDQIQKEIAAQPTDSPLLAKARNDLAQKMSGQAAKELAVGEAHIRQEHLNSVNDIIEHTRQENLRAAGDKVGAEVEGIRYKFEGTGGGNLDSGGLIRDAKGDTVKQHALLQEEQSEIAAAKRQKDKQIEFLSPMAAWHKMQEIGKTVQKGGLPPFARELSPDEIGDAMKREGFHRNAGESMSDYIKRSDAEKSRLSTAITTAPHGMNNAHPTMPGQSGAPAGTTGGFDAHGNPISVAPGANPKKTSDDLQSAADNLNKATQNNMIVIGGVA